MERVEKRDDQPSNISFTYQHRWMKLKGYNDHQSIYRQYVFFVLGTLGGMLKKIILRNSKTKIGAIFSKFKSALSKA